jgi:light-regulated signal transduction histidine kinase (bacteriophytochrome)
MLVAAFGRPLTRLMEQTRRTVEITERAVLVDGKPVIVSVGRDVTERERAGQELKARMLDLAGAYRDLEQFANVTSHDLSEPLRMIASYSQLLSRRCGESVGEEGREFLGYVVTGARRMDLLLQDVMHYTRAASAALKLDLEPLDRALDAALGDLREAVLRSGAVIERGELPALRIDRAAVRQLLRHLLDNALKFRRAGAPPRIRIDARREPQGAWVLRVQDNGIGIEQRYHERIFAIFQRLHAREQYEGNGIGLALCKKIVERHGGELWVESVPGTGSTFSFRLGAGAETALANA